MYDKKAVLMIDWETVWKDYPSQDNEGFQPDRAGFKYGWHCCAQEYKAKIKESLEWDTKTDYHKARQILRDLVKE